MPSVNEIRFPRVHLALTIVNWISLLFLFRVATIDRPTPITLLVILTQGIVTSYITANVVVHFVDPYAEQWFPKYFRVRHE